MYDGSAYSGFQRLPGEKTIQGTIEASLSELLCESIRVTGMSRTDAKVHAYSQYGNFYYKYDVDEKDFIKQINERLPEDIRITGISKIPLDFHVRRAAKSKTYRYRMYTGAVKNVFMRKYAYRTECELDVAAMRTVAVFLVGKHDFKAFSSVKEEKDTVREIFSIDILEENNVVDIVIKGDGFLYNMIRIIAGTLFMAGQGRMSGEAVLEALETRQRSLTGPTLPGYALTLIDAEF